jgi:uncharacterized delta-60 repeat protein
MDRSIRTRVLRSVLALALAGTVESSFANYEGSLDSTFNAGGAGVPGLRRYPVDLGGGAPYTDQDIAAAVMVQADGKIVVAGYAWNSVGSIDQNACVLARYLADGQPDPAFNSGARIVFNFNPIALENDCYFDSVALQPDGKILAAGHRAQNGAENATIFRFNANGSLDGTFASASPHPGYLVLEDGTAFNKVLVDSDGSIYGIGRGVQLNASDYDFFLHAFDPNGVGTYFRYVAFDRGGDLDDRAATAVLQHIPSGSCGPNCLVTAHTELYLVGSANGAPYPDMPDHDCAVAAFRSDFASAFEFVTDTQFGGSGKLSVDFPVSGSNEGDNVCRAAVARAGSGAVLGGYGVVIGGENYFISTLGGGTPGLASTYALADVDGAGSVTREDAFAFFQELATPGIYNGAFGMARDASGRILIAGYASTTDVNRAPSDFGVIRFNADYTRDMTFGNDGAGLAVLSLDGTFPGQQREWASALALDRADRLVIAGNRSFNYASGSNDYDWVIARLNSDVIFRDGFDGVPL